MRTGRVPSTSRWSSTTWVTRTGGRGRASPRDRLTATACAPLGAPEEGAPSHDAGVILNGLHETWPIHYPEDAHGLARVGQTVVNATDGSIIRLFVDDEPLDLGTAGLLRFERVLDPGTGVLSREVEWETLRGRRVLVRSRRLASLEDRHLAAWTTKSSHSTSTSGSPSPPSW